MVPFPGLGEDAQSAADRRQAIGHAQQSSSLGDHREPETGTVIGDAELKAAVGAGPGDRC
jgi:hypothetical protein